MSNDHFVIQRKKMKLKETRTKKMSENQGEKLHIVIWIFYDLELPINHTRYIVLNKIIPFLPTVEQDMTKMPLDLYSFVSLFHHKYFRHRLSRTKMPNYPCNYHQEWNSDTFHEWVNHSWHHSVQVYLIKQKQRKCNASDGEKGGCGSIGSMGGGAGGQVTLTLLFIFLAPLFLRGG